MLLGILLKNIVAAGLSKRCKVELAYMIGVAEPVSVNVDTFGDFHNDLLLTSIVRKTFPMTPTQIINHFDLNRPIYADTAKNGHFGRENLPWEKTDKVDELKVVSLLEKSEF
jgi:S-adenosylmethionine synthetase